MSCQCLALPPLRTFQQRKRKKKKIPPRGHCTSSFDCQSGRALICNAITGCSLDGSRCCVTRSGFCSQDCDCCGTDVCRDSLCQSPETPEVCDSTDYTVICPYRDSCCRPEAPYCCFSRPGCCAKGFPYCCPPTPTLPDYPEGYCCRAGTACCSTGCCQSGGRDGGEPFEVPDAPPMPSEPIGLRTE